VRGDGARANDRCYREVTSEGTRSILCDMHREGGPDAVGEKCPYYCDREGCRRAERYEVEQGFYCAPHAMLVLKEARKADGVSGAEVVEVEYADQEFAHTAYIDGRVEIFPILEDIDCPACAGVLCLHICPGKYGTKHSAKFAAEPEELSLTVETTVNLGARIWAQTKDGKKFGYAGLSAVYEALRTADWALENQTPKLHYSKEHLAEALSWIERHHGSVTGNEGIRLVARALAESAKG
jgi:hypothetical protein